MLQVVLMLLTHSNDSSTIVSGKKIQSLFSLKFSPSLSFNLFRFHFFCLLACLLACSLAYACYFILIVCTIQYRICIYAKKMVNWFIHRWKSQSMSCMVEAKYTLCCNKRITVQRERGENFAVCHTANERITMAHLKTRVHFKREY